MMLRLAFLTLTLVVLGARSAAAGPLIAAVVAAAPAIASAIGSALVSTIFSVLLGQIGDVLIGERRKGSPR